MSALQWTALILVAWIAGAFKWLRLRTKSPKLECVPTASFCFIENLEDFRGNRNVVRAAFFIHASIVNRSPSRAVIDRFRLGFACRLWYRSMRQRMLRLALPSRPRKRLGTGHKLMGSFFTDYDDGYDDRLTVRGSIESSDYVGGYLLFVSNTYGNWNPRVIQDTVEVRLTCTLTTGEKLTHKAKIRVTSDLTEAEEFCPGILEHITDESTWNHEV